MANITYFTQEKTKGRPIYILNDKGKQLIEQLYTIGCVDEEVATMLGVTVETLQNSKNKDAFLECKQKGLTQEKVSLRRYVHEGCRKGNASLLIFACKNILGWVDKVENVDDTETKEQLDKVVEAIKAVRSE